MTQIKLNQLDCIPQSIIIKTISFKLHDKLNPITSTLSICPHPNIEGRVMHGSPEKGKYTLVEGVAFLSLKRLSTKTT